VSEIAFVKDIVKKTAEDLGVTEYSVERLYIFYALYMNTILNRTDCCAWKIPHLGTLYIKESYIDETLKNIDSSDLQEYNKRKRKLLLTYKKDALKIYKQRLKRTMEESFHCMPEEIEKHGNKTLEQIQYLQNTVYEETMANTKKPL